MTKRMEHNRSVDSVWSSVAVRTDASAIHGASTCSRPVPAVRAPFTISTRPASDVTDAARMLAVASRWKARSTCTASQTELKAGEPGRHVMRPWIRLGATTRFLCRSARLGGASRRVIQRSSCSGGQLANLPTTATAPSPAPGSPEPVNDFETLPIAMYCAVSPLVDVTGGLIQTASGRGSGFGMPRTKRSGCRVQAACRVRPRAVRRIAVLHHHVERQPAAPGGEVDLVAVGPGSRPVRAMSSRHRTTTTASKTEADRRTLAHWQRKAPTQR